MKNARSPRSSGRPGRGLQPPSLRHAFASYSARVRPAPRPRTTADRGTSSRLARPTPRGGVRRPPASHVRGRDDAELPFVGTPGPPTAHLRRIDVGALGRRRRRGSSAGSTGKPSTRCTRSCRWNAWPARLQRQRGASSRAGGEFWRGATPWVDPRGGARHATSSSCCGGKAASPSARLREFADHLSGREWRRAPAGPPIGLEAARFPSGERRASARHRPPGRIRAAVPEGAERTPSGEPRPYTARA